MSCRNILRLTCFSLVLSLAAAAQSLPRGTKLLVRLERSLSSDGVRSGDSFEATLAQSVEVRGRVLAPEGARVRGTVSYAEATEGQQKPGTLTIELASIELEKASYPLSTSRVTRRGKGRKNNEPKPGPATVAGSVIDVFASGKHAPLDTSPGDATGQIGGKGSLEAVIPAQFVVAFKTTRESKAVPHE